MEGEIKGGPQVYSNMPRYFRKRYTLPASIVPEGVSWQMHEGCMEIRGRASKANELPMEERQAIEYVRKELGGSLKCRPRFETVGHIVEALVSPGPLALSAV